MDNMPYIPLQKQPHWQPDPFAWILIIISVLLFMAIVIGVARAEDINLQKENYKLSEHFCSNEFSCKHCGVCKINIQLLMALENLRELANAPVVIISGYRCPEHNKKVGGTSKSQHLYGNAVDVRIKGYTPVQIAEMAKHCGFTWTKTYKNWAHIDIRQIKLARTK